MKAIIKGMIALFEWLFVQIFRWPFYHNKYLKGKWFRSVLSDGWHWAYVDILHRILYHKHLNIPWPVSPYINCGREIVFDVDDINLFQGIGNYYQTFSKITIGKGTWIAQNVGIITANHNLENPEKHLPAKDVVLGENCWVGMNSMILPGVVLGPHTVVGAGSVVTKSFPDGYVVIAGNPAKVIKHIL